MGSFAGWKNGRRVVRLRGMKAFLCFLVATLALGIGDTLHAGKPKKGQQPLTADEITAQLDRIVLPSVKFENTSIREAAQFLVNESRRHDPQRKGADIMLQQPPVAVSPASSKVVTASQHMYCKINYQGGATPLRILLDELCRQCDFEWAAMDVPGMTRVGNQEVMVHNIMIRLVPRGIHDPKPVVPEKPRK
jgi:hypothetical protein